MPLPSPRQHAAVSETADPIGALLEREGLVPQATPARAAALPVVLGVHLEEGAERTRLVVELSDPVDAHLFTLTNPDRVVIDLPEVLWRGSDSARPSGKGAVKSYRYGLFRKGNSRFVIDLNRPMRPGKPQLLPPQESFAFRLAIDLLPSNPEAFAAAAGWPAGSDPGAASKPAGIPAPEPGKFVVVVDAGHGGIDPGTHGQSGLKEKDLVLAVAKKLRAALTATGAYSVVMTRDTDVFIPLRERVTIARTARADLFVSLHADSNDHREIRGASVYTLSEDASDHEAAKLAEKENMSDVIAGVDLASEDSPVASILIDLAQRDTMNRSVRFAETVLASLPPATAVRPSRPHRSAGFAVLKAPDVPATLVELGYLSNGADEKEMATEAWRNRVAKALAAAVDRHFADRPRPSRQASVP